MFVKFILTSNDTIISLPTYTRDITHIRLHSLFYKSGVGNTSKQLKLYINGFNDKYDLQTKENYFFYMPLSSYASTANIYNIPVIKNDYVSGLMENTRSLHQLNITCVIDDLKQFVSVGEPVIIELEIV